MYRNSAIQNTKSFNKSILALFVACAFALSGLFGAIPVAHAIGPSVPGCTYTYIPGIPGSPGVPPQQWTIAGTAKVTYCLTAGTYDTQITIHASNIYLMGAPGTTPSTVIIQPTIVMNNGANPMISNLSAGYIGQVPAIIYVGPGYKNITIVGLTVDGSAAALSAAGVLATNGCAGDPSMGCYYGVVINHDSTTDILTTTVTNIYTNTALAPGYGIGIYVTRSSPLISGDTISNYVKNGIECDGAGIACSIYFNSVQPLPAAESVTASNGIMIGYGAAGVIWGNIVTGNHCTIPASCGSNIETQWQATGILTYGANYGDVEGNIVSGNDIGIYGYLECDSCNFYQSNTISNSFVAGALFQDENQTLYFNDFSNSPIGVVAFSGEGPVGMNYKVIVSLLGNTFSSVTLPAESLAIAPGTAQTLFASQTMISCSASVGFGKTTTCHVTVTGSPLGTTGTVTFWEVNNPGSVSFSSPTCTLVSGQCTVSVTGTLPGQVVIAGDYSGDALNAPDSSDGTNMNVGPMTPSIAISCPASVRLTHYVTCSATMSAGDAPYTGLVTWYLMPGTGRVTFSSTTCAPSAITNTCYITITGQLPLLGIAHIEATYTLDPYNSVVHSAPVSVQILPA